MSPRLPGFAVEHGRAFDDPDVARLYHLRRTYPAETYGILLELAPERPVVLDAGAGTGEIARAIAPRVSRVDAVEPSAAMVQAGSRAPGGDDHRIRWIMGTAEEAPLSGPYDLIVCGQSLHWMDWDVVYPRFRRLLAEDAFLASVDVDDEPPWADALRAIVRRYSANRDHIGKRREGQPLIEETRGLFTRAGERRTAPATVRQGVDDYVASHHAMSGLATHRIGAERAAAFDDEVRRLLAPYGDPLELSVTARVTWGRPL
ncbi:MAG TPA: class I SAM-dependent methyltransferase [Candidatus Limnocylindria bacterium]|nr:class I SAM-dependent methyltransferase [Candidatus Limnocylindria bacterium]